MMRIKGNKIYQQKLQAKKNNQDSELGQSEIENQLFEQSIRKTRNSNNNLFLNQKKLRSVNKKKECMDDKSLTKKGELLPEDIQEILFNNNQIYVDKPLKEINKLFRDLKQARKMDKIYKTGDLSQTGSINTNDNPSQGISLIIDNYADQFENCFKNLQTQKQSDTKSLDVLITKIKTFFGELKQITNNDNAHNGLLKSNYNEMKNQEQEIKSLEITV